jgi:hypothetical protein
MTCFCAGAGDAVGEGVGSGRAALDSGTICFCAGAGNAVGVGVGSG